MRTRIAQLSDQTAKSAERSASIHGCADESADELVRLLALSTSGAPDIVIRPDSGTIGALERRPEGGLYVHFRAEDAVDYFEGEEPPRPT